MVWNIAGFFLIFVFLKFIVDLILMVIRHMENNKITFASFGFCENVLSVSYNFFKTTVVTSINDLRVPPLVAIETNWVDHHNNVELYEIRHDAKKNKSTPIQYWPRRLLAQSLTHYHHHLSFSKNKELLCLFLLIDNHPFLPSETAVKFSLSLETQNRSWNHLTFLLWIGLQLRNSPFSSQAPFPLQFFGNTMDS